MKGWVNWFFCSDSKEIPELSWFNVPCLALLSNQEVVVCNTGSFFEMGRMVKEIIEIFLNKQSFFNNICCWKRWTMNRKIINFWDTRLWYFGCYCCIKLWTWCVCLYLFDLILKERNLWLWRISLSIIRTNGIGSCLTSCKFINSFKFWKKFWGNLFENMS